jgi:hypothetical protein
MVDLTEVKCSLPESPVNIGDYGSKGVTAAGLKIKVSNNGINASMAHMLFITYDSVCQECNTINGCRLKVNGLNSETHIIYRRMNYIGSLPPQHWQHKEFILLYLNDLRVMPVSFLVIVLLKTKVILTIGVDNVCHTSQVHRG